jgi:hypothetical protein
MRLTREQFPEILARSSRITFARRGFRPQTTFASFKRIRLRVSLHSSAACGPRRAEAASNPHLRPDRQFFGLTELNRTKSLGQRDGSRGTLS